MNDNQRPTTRTVLKNVRLAYTDQLIVPRAFQPGQPEKYSCTILLPPGHEGIEKIEAILGVAATQRWGKRKADWPRPLRGINRDPIVKDCSDYPKIGIEESGWCFVRAGSLEPPGIVDNLVQDLNKADLRRECYSGRWATVTVNAYAYEQMTGAGVTLGLGNIQLLKHDKRLGTARPKPSEEFDPEPLPDDDDAIVANDNADEDDDFVRPPRRPRR
jgi:hypothetical protein